MKTKEKSRATFRPSSLFDQISNRSSDAEAQMCWRMSILLRTINLLKDKNDKHAELVPGLNAWLKFTLDYKTIVAVIDYP